MLGVHVWGARGHVAPSWRAWEDAGGLHGEEPAPLWKHARLRWLLIRNPLALTSAALPCHLPPANSRPRRSTTVPAAQAPTPAGRRQGRRVACGAPAAQEHQEAVPGAADGARASGEVRRRCRVGCAAHQEAVPGLVPPLVPRCWPPAWPPAGGLDASLLLIPPPPPPALSWHSAVYHTTCPIQPAPTCMRLYFPCSRCRQRAERQETEKEREREPRDRSRCVASSALLRSMRQACIRCIRGTCLGAFCAACRCAAATAAEMGQFLGCACHAVPPCATSHPAYLTAGSARRLNAQRTAAGA